jgi:hypothetical protein
MWLDVKRSDKYSCMPHAGVFIIPFAIPVDTPKHFNFEIRSSNSLSKRFHYLNGKIPLFWFNLQLNSYKNSIQKEILGFANMNCE